MDGLTFLIILFAVPLLAVLIISKVAARVLIQIVEDDARGTVNDTKSAPSAKLMRGEEGLPQPHHSAARPEGSETPAEGP